MRVRLLSVAIERETDIVLVRQRARKIADLAGFDTQDQTRITTALSEIARNAWEYGGGGRVEFWLDTRRPQRLELVVQDQGKGIADIEAVLAGTYRSGTGMGLGILGARRLMESFDVETAPGRGTTVRMARSLPRRAPVLGSTELAAIGRVLASESATLDPLDEIRQQNRELVVQLGELQRRQHQLSQLNQELEDTNRGVVALYAELDERADHLRRADQLKSRFLSNMSHEFRTPLNSILALARLLLARTDGELTPEQERQVQFIRKAAENLTDLVNDLLDLARVEAGKIVISPAEFNVTSLFGALRGMLRPLLVAEGVALVFEDATDVPPLVTDEAKVSQILRNFLSNAIKFTERGEIRVWAQSDPAADTISFFVRDTGVGIAPSQIETIWQEFGQVDNPLQSKVKGTGLGLPLSKKLAELLGGGVHVESWPEQGSLFSLTVPRVYAGARATAEPEAAWQIDPGRVAVLAIEDDPADALVLQRALKESRYQLIGARSTAEARRALERILPAAVLLDLVLVGEESWKFLIEMKQRPLTERIPVVAVSSLPEERKARGLGADDYLEKPVDPSRLIQALEALTGHHSVTKVLMVDDEEVSRYLVRQLLPLGAFEIKEASNGADGLKLAREDAPDVVLFDLAMPVMNGFEFLDGLAQSEPTRSLPAIALTSMRLSAQQRQQLARAVQIVPKSELSADVLVAAIRQAVRPRPEKTL